MRDRRRALVSSPPPAAVRDALRATRAHDAPVVPGVGLLGVPLVGERAVRSSSIASCVRTRRRDAGPARRGRGVDARSRRSGRGRARRTRSAEAFLGLLGHDLRAALAAVANTIDALVLGPYATPGLEVIERQIAHMARLAGDLADVSRIARGSFELDLRPIELAEVVATALQMQRGLLPVDRAVAVDVMPHGLVVLGDLDRLARVVGRMVRPPPALEPGRRDDHRRGLSRGRTPPCSACGRPHSCRAMPRPCARRRRRSATPRNHRHGGAQGGASARRAPSRQLRDRRLRRHAARARS